jgi:putative membrane protein
LRRPRRQGLRSRVGPINSAWLIIFVSVLAWSAWNPHDYPTWWLEVAPALLALAVLAATRQRFPLTPLAYWLILVHAVILMIGGHYTYAEVPLGDWVREWTDGTRNNYDKVGHLAQGFIPAIVVREVLVRNRVLAREGWLSLFVVSVCLSISALYELIEWWVALLSGEAAEAFLGTQGYVWDTQSDMFLALIGAVLALAIFSRRHDRQIEAVTGARPS